MEKKKLRILYIGNFSPNSVGEPEIAWSLEELGHEVKRVEEGTANCFEVFQELKRGYDLLLFAKSRVGGYDQVQKLFNQTKTPKVCWVFDIYWGL